MYPRGKTALTAGATRRCRQAVAGARAMARARLAPGGQGRDRARAAAQGIKKTAIGNWGADAEDRDGFVTHPAARLGRVPELKKAKVGAVGPYDHMGTAKDLTGNAIFLASDEARRTVARTFFINGRNWMS